MNKVIIADTSCLIALNKIEILDILKKLYGEVIVTKEVNEEFGETLPNWIVISEVKDKTKQFELETKLDKGEASSIALAITTPDSLLIIDEYKGRKIAKALDLNIIGTIGILLSAYKKGILPDLIGTILRLVNSGFRLSDVLLDRILEKYRKK